MSKQTVPHGTLINQRYLIQKVLGQGSFGRTYAAVDTHQGNASCVLKEFAPTASHRQGQPKARTFFWAEAERLSQMKHPQIPSFIDFFEAEDRLFLAQAYVGGKTYSELLRSRLKQKSTFSEPEVISWLKSLLPVLDYIHENDLVHRDISPDNILLPANDHPPVLVDFGVGKQLLTTAQLVGGSLPQPVSMGSDIASFVGTMPLGGKVGYAPHEQIRLGLCSPSSDLYALGVSAVVLLTGEHPYRLINHYSLRWEWRERSQVSPAFGLILDQLLTDTRAARYRTAREVSNDLSNIPLTNMAMPAVLKKNIGRLQTVETDLATGTQRPEDGLSTMLPERPLTGNSPPLKVVAATAASPAPVSQTESSLSSSGPTLTPSFVEQCQRKLADYIGPMASMIVEEAILNEAPTTPTRLVELLLPELPNPAEAKAFHRDLLG